jgi:hypothetical protein
MWHVYNLVREGDHVTATTFRKISKDAAAGSESERIKLKLMVKVEGIEFDPEGRSHCRDFTGVLDVIGAQACVERSIESQAAQT